MPRISPAFIAFLLAGVLVALAAAAISVPATSVLLLLIVAWATARGGTQAGAVTLAICALALVALSTLRKGPVTWDQATEEIVVTVGFGIVVYLVGSIKQQLDEARSMHVPLRMDAVAAEDRLTRVLESITDGFLTLDPDWHITNVNRRGEQMLGRTRQKLIGRYILDAFPEGVGSVIHREMDRARRDRTAVEIEAFYSPGNRWFEVRGYPADDGSMTVYYRDVTKRKRAQEALGLQARMLDTVRQGVIGIEPDGVIFYWNRAAEEMLGWKASQVVGRTTSSIMQPDNGAGADGTTMLKRRDGSLFPADYTDSPILDEGGLEIGTVRVVADLSDRQAEQQSQRFLAHAGAEIASTLDLDALLTAAQQLIVPTLGDCTIIELVEEENASRRIESCWSSSLAGEAPRQISRRTFETKLSAASLLHENRATLLPRINDGVLRALTSDATELDRLRRAGIRSAVITPLEAGGRMLGTMSVLCTHRVYGDADIALLGEFGRRVALAADNAIHFEAARIASKAKSDFLAVMSHELRTPLTTVMGYTDLLLAEVSGALSNQSRTYVDRIRGAAWHLLTLIEQILIYTRVEIGREQVHVERVPLDFVLRDAAALIEPVAGERGLNFRLVPPETLAYLDTDLTKLRQILLNLLSNAVKFTEKGEVVLSAQVHDTSVSIIVRDTGMGIAPEHVERIFESFWQVDQSATRRAGGTGLGLTVARKLARLLGGDVHVQSEEGSGSEFRVELPLGSLTLPSRT